MSRNTGGGGLAVRRGVLALAAVFLCGPFSSEARPRVLTVADAIAIARNGNPALAAALLEVRKAAASVTAEEGLYPFQLSAGLSGSRTKTPGAGAGGDITFRTSDEIAVAAGIGKSFATGTRIDLDLTGSWDRSSGVASLAGIGLAASSDSGYGLTGRLTLTQPLLRGFGTRVGEAGLRLARIQRNAAEQKAARVASELLRDVLTAFWELWYREQVVRVQEDAIALARRQVDEVRSRIVRGSAAPADELLFLTALASREEEWVQAREARQRQALELARLLGMTGNGGDLVVAETEIPEPAAPCPDVTESTATARAESHRIRELQAQVDTARDQLQIAGESDRPRLDLKAWAQGQGYGNGSPRPAFEQIGTAQAGGVFAGLTFEMPLSGTREAAEKAAARFALEIAKQNLDAAIQQIDAEAATWVVRRESADRRLELAGRTEEASQRQAEAERRRYEAGTAIPIQVLQAEDSLRQARLRVLRARVDRIQAEFGIDALSDALLRRFGTGE